LVGNLSDPKATLAILNQNVLNKIQVAEFAFPFPAKIYEKELVENHIDFDTFIKSSGERGFDVTIFYVKDLDFERAYDLKEKVDKENATSELKHLHPIRKVIAYVGLLFVIYLLISNVIKLFNDDFSPFNF